MIYCSRKKCSSVHGAATLNLIRSKIQLWKVNTVNIPADRRVGTTKFNIVLNRSESTQSPFLYLQDVICLLPEAFQCYQRM